MRKGDLLSALIIWVSVNIVVESLTTSSRSSRSIHGSISRPQLLDVNVRPQSKTILKATVEEDLDDALDNLLVDALNEAEGDVPRKFRIKSRSPGPVFEENDVSKNSMINSCA